MSEFKADLHCHSCFSDGTDAPEELIDLALASGLAGLSITDHDTIAAYPKALELAKQKNLHLLPGIEFSAAYGVEPVHILGYGYDLKSEAIIDLCRRHRKRREERNFRILEKLKKIGIEITLNEKHIQGSWGRPHIAQAMMEKGVVQSLQEAFHLYLGEGKRAYDPGETISVMETIEIIHAGKGKAILAHPHLLKRSTTIRALLKMPFDGLEGYYARMVRTQEQKWIDIAKNKNWILTGGSDYHGTTKPNYFLGSSWTPQEAFERLCTPS